MMQLETNKDAWELIKFYFEQNPPDSAHIRSYNDFLTKIDKLTTKQVSHEYFTCGMKDVKCIEPCVRKDGKKEQVFPSSCIADKSSYESELTCTFWFSWKDKVYKEEEGITIGMIPVMVGSELCNLVNNKTPKDLNKPVTQQKPSTKRWKKMMSMEFKTGLGGWFVKDGTSRYITFQERNKFNHPMAFIINSTSKNKKYTHYVEVRNSVTDENTTTILSINLDKNGQSWVAMKYLDDKKEIAPFLFFYALGYTDPIQILSFIISKSDPLFKLTYVKMMIQRMFEQAKSYSWKDELSNLGIQAVDNKDEYIENLIEHKFLHHYSSKRKKAIYFGFVIYCLISISVPDEIKRENPHIRFVKEDDRDHFGKKILNTESTLFSNVYYTAVRKMLDIMEKNVLSALKGKSEEMMATIVKDMNAKMIFPESDITKMPITMMLSKALTINMWGKQKRDGVSSVFDPINYNNAVTMLMRSCIPLQSHIGNLHPRMVHGSFIPYVDPFDTPEGDSIGYNKILSVLTYVSSEIDIKNIREWLINNVSPITNKEGKRVYIDNEWIGVQAAEKCKELYEDLLYKKTHGQVDPTISVVWNHIKEELHVFSQEGRVLRPFLIVENGKILYNKTDHGKYASWEDLCGSGKVVMLDPNEFEFVKLWAVSIDAFNSLPMKERKRYSHVEIHPATFFGAGSGSITSPNMAQGPRNSYGANMKRQSVGTTCRFDSQRTLFYPQRALVRNKIDTLLLHYDEYPAGVNVQVALMPALGFEQEDGYIISSRFLEMGGFMSNKVTKHIIQIDGNDEKLEIPKENECYRFKPKNLQNIGKDGIIKKGSIVRMNDPLCCKVLMESNGQYKKVDCTFYHTEENVCWVTDVIVSEKGYRDSKMIKIVLTETRIGKNGNKFSPRCAQKGTCTYICPYEDMPFDPVTRTSISVIVNPLCIPSRMTISYLHEIFLGEYICMPDKDGKYDNIGYENCTPYDEDPLLQYKHAEAELKRMGFRTDGRKTLIDGRTGETIETDIFCGHVHMQVLKHMVDDKISKRATGPIATLMKCPTEGRSRGGGVKTGTMEKDTIAANDCPEILMDRFCLSSDRIETTACRICGVIETRNKDFKTKCKACKTDSMVPITMSNSPKVVFSELMAMGILPRLIIGDLHK